MLNIVWELEKATVADVRERILVYREIAYTTIMTVMKNLGEKGYLRYEQEGNSYVYSPARPAHDVKRSLLRELMTSVFSDSPLALVQTLVEDEKVSPKELDEIKATIRSIDGEEDRDV